MRNVLSFSPLSFSPLSRRAAVGLEIIACMRGDNTGRRCCAAEFSAGVQLTFLLDSSRLSSPHLLASPSCLASTSFARRDHGAAVVCRERSAHCPQVRAGDAALRSLLFSVRPFSFLLLFSFFARSRPRCPSPQLTFCLARPRSHCLVDSPVPPRLGSFSGIAIAFVLSIARPSPLALACVWPRFHPPPSLPASANSQPCS